MRNPTQKIKSKLRNFDFKSLFIEQLGWDICRHLAVSLNVEQEEFELLPIAEKKGMIIFHISGKIPDRGMRAKIARAAKKQIHENLIVFTNENSQLWLWTKISPLGTFQVREHYYSPDQDGEALYQKLKTLTVSIEEEKGLTLVDVTDKSRRAFDSEVVTKKFYDKFKNEHAHFMKFITGIKDVADKEWYASLTLNRLMFCYFIQKKGFLNSQMDYLERKLEQTKKIHGKNKFDTFFNFFLKRLFHDGLGSINRTPDLEFILGKVPYFNGGLFNVHDLESQYSSINIADEAFESLFKFFNEFSWHLDTRPLKFDNEINPDVLGFIFEKYINQKEMGAYYTKEDITSYICSSSILPTLIRKIEQDGTNLLGKKGLLSVVFSKEPQRYIPEALATGLNEKVPSALEKAWKSKSWDELNTKTSHPFGNKGETWIDFFSRRDTYSKRSEELLKSNISSVEELVASNVDIAQGLHDVVAESTDPAFILNVWNNLGSLKVLDPACGSGAFLFAALNVLEPLYMVCLDSISAILRDNSALIDGKTRAQFQSVLKELDLHANKHYFIQKKIVLSNLYGADLMKEAVEVCKLRLFLKLASNLSQYSEIEPLPDLDFNIRPGNSLIGYTSIEQYLNVSSTELTGQMLILTAEDKKISDDITDQAEVSERAFDVFREMQIQHGLNGSEFYESKKYLQEKLQKLKSKLDISLARSYGVNVKDNDKVDTWRINHKPLHWFVEFYGVMKKGGFSVIVGNPPWKEYAKVKTSYTVRNLKTEDCGNLHAMFTEKSLNIRDKSGVLSFIVQLPLVNSSRMKTAREILRLNSSFLTTLTFDDRPGKLFDGLEHCRSVIFSSHGKQSEGDCKVLTSRYHRWITESRESLFQNFDMAITSHSSFFSETFPKFACNHHSEIFEKVFASCTESLTNYCKSSSTKDYIFYQEAVGYWIKAVVGLPYYAKDGKKGPPAHGRYLYFDTSEETVIASAILNSSLFYLFFITYSDCFHLTDSLVKAFKVPKKAFSDKQLLKLGQILMDDLKNNSEKKTINTKAGCKITYAEFYGAKSKSIIDQIDERLATIYGLSEEQVRFIQQYDYKFRMGRSS